MSETCAVCRKGKGPEKCEVCGFSDNGFINRQFPIPEDAKNWIEKVVKPYRAQWEAKQREAELLAELEASKKREAELLTQVENSRNMQKVLYTPQTQPTPSPTPKKQTSSKFTKSMIGIIILIIFVVIMMSLPNSNTYFKSGNANYEKKNYDKAIEDYTAAIKIKPDNPVYLNSRGLAYYEKKDYDKAIEDLTAAIKLKPDDPVYLHNRGMGYHNKGDYNLAITDFETALRINPNYDSAKKNLNLAKTEYTRQTQSMVTTKSTFTDSRDGKIYKTVKIGNQVWMAENLNFNASGSKCYGNKESNCTKYGRLYNWETAIKACPSGWHLPSNKEWQTNVDFVGGEKVAGKKLKAKSGWSKDGNGIDDFGFSALPGGSGYSYGSFYHVGIDGYWWSTSEYNSNDAYYRYMTYDYEGVRYGSLYKSILFSVRCLQDNGNSALTKPVETETTKKAVAKENPESIQQVRSMVTAKNTLTDSRDSKTYKTIKIGNQVWMAENLSYNASGSKCYDNKESNCAKYGRLYNWETAIKACPKGWHLPSNKEWQTLVDFVGDGRVAGKKLKAKNGWYKDGNGIDDFGFSALPGGFGYSDGSFSSVGYNGIWWSASGYYTSYADTRGMGYIDGTVSYIDNDKSYLFSVRCLQD